MARRHARKTRREAELRRQVRSQGQLGNEGEREKAGPAYLFGFTVCLAALLALFCLAAALAFACFCAACLFLVFGDLSPMLITFADLLPIASATRDLAGSSISWRIAVAGLRIPVHTLILFTLHSLAPRGSRRERGPICRRHSCAGLSVCSRNAPPFCRQAARSSP